MIERLKHFKEQVDAVAKDVGCDGERINSHKIASSVYAYCDSTDQYFDVIEIEEDFLLGCRCGSGLIIKLREDKS